MDQVTIPRAVYDSLITQATNVATTAIKTGVVLSEEYEEAMSNISNNLLATIAQCPPILGGYDGTWREKDVQAERFRHDSQPVRGPGLGCKVRHLPTGLAAESYMKGTYEENLDSAMRALRTMVYRQGQKPRP